MKRVIFLLFIFLFCVSVFAQPPFQSTEGISNELSIIAPKESAFDFNDVIKLHFHVHNSTGYLLNISGVSCLGHVYGHNGSHVFEGELDKESNYYDFELVLNKSLLTGVGDYGYTIYCNSTGGEAGFLSTDFYVSLTGLDNLEMFRFSLLYIFSLTAILFVLLYISFNLDERHLALKFFIVTLSIFLCVTYIRNLYLLEPIDIISDFNKYYMNFIKAYAIYVFLAFLWFIGEYYGKTDGIKQFFRDKFGNNK